MSKFGDWDAVTAFALSLPGTELSTYYGGPAVKVAANGRPLVAPSHEADSFGLHIDEDSKAILMETAPGSFWQTPHYDGYPCVLVRYRAEDPDRVEDAIRRALAWTTARKPAAVRKRK